MSRLPDPLGFALRLAYHFVGAAVVYMLLCLALGVVVVALDAAGCHPPGYQTP